MDALSNGIALGLLLTLLVGPVFFALLQISLAYGFRAGAQMVVGIAVSDLVFIFISYFGLAPIAATPTFQYWMGIIGGGIMMVFGLTSILKKPAPQTHGDNALNKARGWRLALRAFALNGLNPFVLIFWLTTTSNIISRYPSKPLSHALFFGGMIITAVLTDLGKAYAAKRLSTVLNPRILRFLTLLVGVALVVYGAHTIYKVWTMV